MSVHKEQEEVPALFYFFRGTLAEVMYLQGSLPFLNTLFRRVKRREGKREGNEPQTSGCLAGRRR